MGRGVDLDDELAAAEPDGAGVLAHPLARHRVQRDPPGPEDLLGLATAAEAGRAEVRFQRVLEGVEAAALLVRTAQVSIVMGITM